MFQLSEFKAGITVIRNIAPHASPPEVASDAVSVYFGWSESVPLASSTRECPRQPG